MNGTGSERSRGSMERATLELEMPPRLPSLARARTEVVEKSLILLRLGKVM